jgi:hypothetical protein
VVPNGQKLVCGGRTGCHERFEGPIGKVFNV